MTFTVRTSGHFDINQANISSLIKQQDGPVVRKFMEVGEAVKIATVESLKDGFVRDFLGPWIVKRLTVQEDGPHILVGTDHVKTEPHPIIGNPILSFNWPRVGGDVFFRSVQHPGSDFTAYVQNKLVEAVEKVKGSLL